MSDIRRCIVEVALDEAFQDIEDDARCFVVDTENGTTESDGKTVNSTLKPVVSIPVLSERQGVMERENLPYRDTIQK